MSEDLESPDVEPEDSGEDITVRPHKGRRAFTNVRRELSDEELSSPAVQRMLIDDIERLEKEKFDLSEYQEKFHEADKNAAILEEKLKASVTQEITAVSAGDLVVLYTKSGRENEKELKSGRKAHFFYCVLLNTPSACGGELHWGLDPSIWERKDRAPVLLHAPEWISKGPEDL
jgi:hypothetical protein